jgi:hypothetical protein
MILISCYTELMQKVRKLITTIGVFVLLASPVLASAGQVVAPTALSIADLIKGVLQFLPILVLVVLLGMLIYGGFVRMTAAGDEDKEKQSSQILTAAVIGFIIIALSPLLINFIGTLLGLGQLIK